MPYIEPERRRELAQLLIDMGDAQVKANGELNYLLYTYCKRTTLPSYNKYKNYIAELRACATEIERRLLGPYEDEKIKENGDID